MATPLPEASLKIRSRDRSRDQTYSQTRYKTSLWITSSRPEPSHLLLFWGAGQLALCVHAAGALPAGMPTEKSTENSITYQAGRIAS